MNCLKTVSRSCSRCASVLNSLVLVHKPVYRQSWRPMCGTSYSVYRLKSRGILQFHGPDTVQFLQGLVTNEATELEEKKVQYNMLLNVQGRVMYDLILYSITTSDGASVLMECQRDIAAQVLTDIKRFKIRKKVEILDSSDKFDVLAAVSGADSADTGPPKLASAVIQNTDPRVPSFGQRIIVEKNISDVPVCDNEAGYHERRYQWGIPEGTVDLPPGNCFPLESNLVFMNGVCFTKGCYLGQELTARTYHTGVTRKRVMPLVFDSDPLDIEPGENIKNEKGKSVGKFRNRTGLYGLGLMRVGEVEGSLTVTNRQGQTVSVRAHKPSWWPEGS